MVAALIKFSDSLPPLHDMSRLIEFFERSVTIFFRLKKFFDDFSEKNAGAEKKAGDDSS